jgi:hypothetical protein
MKLIGCRDGLVNGLSDYFCPLTVRVHAIHKVFRVVQ